MINCLWTLREVEHRAHYDVVYEWEDSISETLQAKVRKLNKPDLFLHRAFCKVFKRHTLHQDINKDVALFFVMSPSELRYFPHYNVLPVFLDIWSDKDIDFVLEKAQKLKLFYVTSYMVYEKMKEKNPGCNVRYMPLSVSDKYYSENFNRYANKTIDVIQMGRNNPVLHKFMLRYVEENPETEYVYTKDVDHNSNLEYISTKRGGLGIMKSREDFINMLSSAKVSLVSTPAMDNSRKNANGISFPTPRFYESAIFGCNLIGRYEENRETEEIGINKICFNAKDYEAFAAQLKCALSNNLKDLFDENRDFIQRNLSSRRADQIMKELAEIIRANS